MGVGNTQEWRLFQERVADLFRRILTCKVTVNETLHGARIGSVEVDVVARFGAKRAFGPPQPRFVFTVLVECKFWKTRVPQEKIFALKAIVEDTGAAQGILVSDLGVQKGASEFLCSPINVKALTFAELEAYVDGGFLGICSDCGKQVTFPFSLSEGKHQYCSDCYQKYKRF
jgi:CxxC-x17-CxxC domain-containing protein